MMERNAPSDSLRAVEPVPALALHPDTTSAGDDLAMPLTLVSRTHGRAPTDTPHPHPAVDRGRSWLTSTYSTNVGSRW